MSACFMEIICSLPCLQEPAEKLHGCCKTDAYLWTRIRNWLLTIFKVFNKKKFYLTDLFVRSACTAHLGLLFCF